MHSNFLALLRSAQAAAASTPATKPQPLCSSQEELKALKHCATAAQTAIFLEAEYKSLPASRLNQEIGALHDPLVAARERCAQLPPSTATALANVAMAHMYSVYLAAEEYLASIYRVEDKERLNKRILCLTNEGFDVKGRELAELVIDSQDLALTGLTREERVQHAFEALIVTEATPRNPNT